MERARKREVKAKRETKNKIERERESVTAGEVRQSIRLPGPKELKPGFVEKEFGTLPDHDETCISRVIRFYL